MIRDLPEQINFLDASFAQMAIARIPMTTYTVQEIFTPVIRLPDIRTGNPFVQLNYAGDTLLFDDLEVVFKVDDNFRNYNEIYDWMRGLAFPESHQQYVDLKADPNGYGSVRSDVTVVISSVSKVARIGMVFRDAFPKSLSGITFTTTANGPPLITARVYFSIRDFTIESIVE